MVTKAVLKEDDVRRVWNLNRYSLTVKEEIFTYTPRIEPMNQFAPNNVLCNTRLAGYKYRYISNMLEVSIVCK